MSNDIAPIETIDLLVTNHGFNSPVILSPALIRSVQNHLEAFNEMRDKAKLPRINFRWQSATLHTDCGWVFEEVPELPPAA